MSKNRSFAGGPRLPGLRSAATKQPWIWIIALVLIIFMGISGHYYAFREFKTIRTAKNKELELIGRTKADQISNWFSDELYDAIAIAGNEVLRDYIFRWEASAENADSLGLSKFIKSYSLQHGYHTIFYTSPDGILKIPSTEKDPDLGEGLIEIIKLTESGSPQPTTDLYRSVKDHRIYIDFIAPVVKSDGSHSGYLVFRFDADSSLYPIIQGWPAPVGTNETYLARVERDSVRVLTGLRYRPDSLGILSYSMKDTLTALVKAASGYTGLTDAMDYRGEKVLAWVGRIPGTSWLIVTKTDSREVFKDAYRELVFMIIVITLSILLVIAGAFLIYRNIRQNAWSELIRSHDEFRMVVQNVNAVIFILNDKGDFELSEGQGLKLLGLKPGQVVGSSAFEMYKDYPDIVQGINRVLKGESVQVELMVQGVYFDTLFTPRRNESGQVNGVIGLATDITYRKQSELMLNIQYNVADAVVKSRNVEELFGIIRKELSQIVDTTNFFYVEYNSSTDQITVPFERDEKNEIPPAWPAEGSLTGYAMRQKQSLLLTEGDIRDLAGQGAIRLLGTVAKCWLGVPVLIHDQPIGAIVVQSYTKADAYDSNSRDILEMIANQLSVYIDRIRTEQTAMRLAKGIEQSPVSILITDPRGTIEYVNPMFTVVTGYSKEEALGENPRILKSGYQPDGFYQDLWDTINSGKDWQGEFYNQRKNGQHFWQSGVISPVMDESGHITHFIAIMEDVTERKHTIQDLIEAKERAEKADRLKTAFLANMSHEIRTPMNAVIGFSELLDDPDTTPAERELYAQTIRKRSFDLLAIINDILDLSSLESGLLKPVKEEGTLAGIMEDCRTLAMSLGHSLRRPQVDFIATLEPELENFSFRTDFRRVRQILTNLIGNAYKFTAFGYIRLECTRPDPTYIRFVVSDTGIGIPPEKMSAVFERFVQADDSLSKQHGGAGLGLPISKGLAELLGGELTADSIPGKGSTFTLVLPCGEG